MAAPTFVADEVVTAAKMNDLPKGTLGLFQGTTPQTGIGTGATDLTNYTLTVTVAAGRRIRLTASGRVQQNTSTASISLSFREGGTTLAFIVAESFVAGAVRVYNGSAILTPSAGSHTYRLVMSTSVSTCDHSVSATVPGFLMVEDLGSV